MAMRGFAVISCALALAPAAFARPYLGLALGDATRFGAQTGQRTALRNIYLGWDQGYRWGSSFDRIIPTLGRIPMISITTFHWPSKKETLTPGQIARGAGDEYLIALNAAIARSSFDLFYVRPLGEMTGWWNPWCAFTRSGHAKGGFHSTGNFRKAFARMYVLLHGGTAAYLDARLARLGLPGVGRDLPGVPFPRLRVIWNPQSHGDPQVAGNTPAAYYPGDAFVDVYGPDTYDLGSVDWGAIERLYRAHPRKGFAFPEWGMTFDDPGFVQRMSSFVRSHRRVELLSFYSGANGGKYDLASKPRARAQYRRLITPLGG
jgi:hypothetical protein